MDPMDIDTATTLASDPGAFGAALATLGFTGEAVPGVSPQTWVFDHPTADLAVTCGTGPEGEWAEMTTPTYTVSFSEDTPQDVALATIAVALGRLSVRW